MKEPDFYNRMIWDGRPRRHHESWVMNLSQVNTQAGFRIRYDLRVSERGPVSAQVSFTSTVPGKTSASVAVARDFPIELLSWTDDPFWLEMGPCIIEPGRMMGMLDAGGTAVTWDLLYRKITDPLLNLPERIYHSPGRNWKLLTPYPFLLMGGKIQIEDHQFILNGDPGQQTHVWGHGFPADWIWFHCSSFFEQGGEPIPAYVSGLVLESTLFGRYMQWPEHFGHLVWREKHIRIRPCTPWQKRHEGRWQWEGAFGKEQVTVQITTPLLTAVVAEYRNAKEQVSHFCYSGQADCLVQFTHGGQAPKLFRAPGMAHAEIGSVKTGFQATRRLIS